MRAGIYSRLSSTPPGPTDPHWPLGTDRAHGGVIWLTAHPPPPPVAGSRWLRFVDSETGSFETELSDFGRSDIGASEGELSTHQHIDIYSPEAALTNVTTSSLSYVFQSPSVDTSLTLAELLGTNDLVFSRVRWSNHHHRLVRLYLGVCNLARSGRFEASGDLTRAAVEWRGALRARSLIAAVCVVAGDYPDIHISPPRTFVSASIYAGTQVGRTERNAGTEVGRSARNTDTHAVGNTERNAVTQVGQTERNAYTPLEVV